MVGLSTPNHEDSIGHINMIYSVNFEWSFSCLLYELVQQHCKLKSTVTITMMDLSYLIADGVVSIFYAVIEPTAFDIDLGAAESPATL